MGSGNLGLDDWYRHGEETDAETLEGTANDECSKVWCECLYKRCDKVDESPESYTLFSTDNIADTARNQRSDGGRDLKTGH